MFISNVLTKVEKTYYNKLSKTKVLLILLVIIFPPFGAGCLVYKFYKSYKGIFVVTILSLAMLVGYFYVGHKVLYEVTNDKRYTDLVKQDASKADLIFQLNQELENQVKPMSPGTGMVGNN